MVQEERKRKQKKKNRRLQEEENQRKLKEGVGRNGERKKLEEELAKKAEIER